MCVFVLARARVHAWVPACMHVFRGMDCEQPNFPASKVHGTAGEGRPQRQDLEEGLRTCRMAKSTASMRVKYELLSGFFLLEPIVVGLGFISM